MKRYLNSTRLPMVCILVGLSVNPALAQRLPEGPGKAALLKVCSPCHGAENVIGQSKTREEWGQLVGEMVSYGAVGTDEELNSIVDYLARNFGKEPKKSGLSKMGREFARSPILR
jgi:mono/diheme cytochrome c family protein